MLLHTVFQLSQSPWLPKAHISNFLNRKRALSLEGLDRVLASQKLSIEHILPLDLNANAHATPTPAENSDPIEIIPVVSPSAAIDAARTPPAAIIETIQVSAS